MKRRIWWLLVALIVLLNLSGPVLASTTIVETTKTTVGFYRPKKATTPAADQVAIPDGQRAYQLVATKPKQSSGSQADRILAKKGPIVAGRLPQTGEWQQWCWSMIGGLLVVILLLIGLIWRQWQYLKLGGDRDCVTTRKI